MSNHSNQRKEKDCLNCGKSIESRYCSYCGQENLNTKQPFHYLITHFIEHKLHYKHGLLPTIKSLLFKPGHIVKLYLNGQRSTFIEPISLYIFISFIVFLLPIILPYPNEEHTPLGQEQLVSHQATVNDADDDDSIYYFSTAYKGISTVHQLDSLQENMPTDKKVSALKYHSERKYLAYREQGLTNDDIFDKYADALQHSLPKFLICYLPFFAFFLWLFHNKKKWYYYEHGVFTLYYFCYLLLLIIPLEVLDFLSERFHSPILEHIEYFMMGVVFLCGFLYFVKAHHYVYRENKKTARSKGLMLLFINVAFMMACLIGYLILIGYLLH